MHIIDHFGFGGAQRILEGLRSSEEYNLYFCALRKKNSKEIIPSNDVYYTRSKSKYSLPLFEIKRFIEKKNIDVLHLHLPKSIYLGIILKSLFFRNMKIIVHEHGDIFENGFIYANFLKQFQSKVDLFIAVSKVTKRKMIENSRIKENKIKVLYNFVDLNKFNVKSTNFDREKERDKLGIKKEDYVVGFAGRLVERKGWREFIKSFALLSHNMNSKAIIIGDGKDKKEMLLMIKNQKIENNIIYKGYIYDVRSFYVLLDCFVIPSHWEPMGITELEAQAMRIPVIASDVDGLNEIIENEKTGLLFKVGNENDLAEKMAIIYKNEKIKNKIIENALKNVKKYSLDNYIIKLREIYGEY